MRVIAAAYDVAASIAGLPSAAAFVPVFDLPLKGPTWAVRERVLNDFRGPERIECSEVTIPAWTAKTELYGLISAPGTGFAEIVKAVLRQASGVLALRWSMVEFDTDEATTEIYIGRDSHASLRISEKLGIT